MRCGVAQLASLMLLACAGAPASPRQPVADVDIDGDRVERDRCVDAPETYNGFEDDDGCPDKPPADRAHCVHNDVISLGDRFFFAAGTTRPNSLELVDILASTILGNPSIENIVVVGTAAPGEPAALALQRAEAIVAHLVDRGVARGRLEPAAVPTRETEPARARTVWVVVTKIDGTEVRTGAERLEPWSRDCAANRRAWRERGEAIDCACLD